MFEFFYLTQISAFLLMSLVVVLILVAYDYQNDKKKSKKTFQDDGLLEPPSPKKFPLIGHLHLLNGYEVPYQAFTDLGKKYGNIIKLQLGNVKCVVVNEHKNIREALVTKGHHFDARPNFERYQQLFCGNKENSLAFCNWSETQKNRREMLRAYTFPRAFTHKFNSLEKLISDANNNLFDRLNSNKPIELKPIILQECANIFTNHFCSKEFSIHDHQFTEMLEDFDDIFYEVNQGYAADFLPFLLPLHKKNLERINNLTHKIRDFVLEKIIGDRFNEFDVEDDPIDYVESLIKNVKNDELPKLSWETALFALEDILGGHSAVGNFLMKVFGFLVNEPEVQRKIQEEIEELVSQRGRNVTIGDRTALPYIEATVFEAIRLIASPIVPRVANQDSSIDGYRVEKDTVLFMNNYDLSMSEKLWEEPTKFKPERFIKNNKIFKPDYFLPFGGGRRSCMGYKMVQLISFGIIAGVLQHYTIKPVENETYKVPIGSLALPKNTFKFNFVKR